ncbi:hypothetical protein [Pedobacter ghigonis]|uniref:hypothetical protein n=1 Tax=Pedobacter ghigonis TaxID=2730403 RepID=UPI001588B790|nr:hypothetical protein [Pedobacter ghigonis]
MLAKELGIFMILCYGVLKMPFQEIKSQHDPVIKDKIAAQKPKSSKPMSHDVTNKQNPVYLEALKYTHGSNSTTFAQITFKNRTKEIITYISFLLDGNVAKGCNKAYEIKRKIKLKPNQSLTISQRLAQDDCEVHEVKNLRIQYVMNINFTLD